MAVKQFDGGTVITGKDVPIARLIVLKNGLKLETKGIKMSRGTSCYAIIKKEFGLKGNKTAVLEQFEKIVEEKMSARTEERAEGIE